MTAPIAPDPAWQRILANNAEDEAWQELTDRNDRLREHAPAAGFKYRHDKETHDQAQDHSHHPRADRAAVAAGPRGRGDVGHRPADLTTPWAGSPPKHPGPLHTPHRGDPVPPNAAPTITAPAGADITPAGHLQEERTP